MTIRRHFWLRYGSALVATMIVFAVRLPLHHYFEGRSFTVIYVPAVMFAALAGGRGPGILATALCLGVNVFFLRGSLLTDQANLIDVASFAVLGPILGFVG